VDHDAVVAALEWWVEHAEAARSTSFNASSRRDVRFDFGPKDSAPIKALREREDQTRQILHRVLGLKDLPVILNAFSDSVSVREGITLCEYALGRLRTQAETRAMLGPAAPTMAADSLHPAVWGMVAGLWEGGHYRVAVQKAVTRLNGDIQDRTNRHDVSDRELMQQVFSTSPPQHAKARLWWPGDENDRSVKSMREGILFFAQGVFSAIRNITTHTTEELPRQEAFEMLTAVSLLSRWVDNCELVESESP
jgi:uncharacterized protein (TIGR02391 family)